MTSSKEFAKVSYRSSTSARNSACFEDNELSTAVADVPFAFVDADAFPPGLLTHLLTTAPLLTLPYGFLLSFFFKYAKGDADWLPGEAAASPASTADWGVIGAAEADAKEPAACDPIS